MRQWHLDGGSGQLQLTNSPGYDLNAWTNDGLRLWCAKVWLRSIRVRCDQCIGMQFITTGYKLSGARCACSHHGSSTQSGHPRWRWQPGDSTLIATISTELTARMA
ncbi:hypothetical protein BR10RB9215_C21145 [Brucella sp. 10RB9215]|nr:hypothetical protein [Brucella sp. 10RB9215]SBW16467.1 hypothetical protein BR10RB9215_C21145 [Brucella sp. 10RB9215]